MKKYVVLTKILIWTFLVLSLNVYSGSVRSDEIELSFPQASNGAYILPVPKNLIPLTSDLSFSCHDIEMNVRARVKLTWPKVDRSEASYVRFLVLDVRGGVSESCSGKMRWSPSESVLPSYLGALPRAQLVYPTFDWLRQAVLLSSNKVVDNYWFVHPQKLQANYVTDVDAMTKQKYPLTQTSQWLYDKPKSLLNLFFADENPKWLTIADTYASYYVSKLGDDGFFSLTKRKDIKYLMSPGLLYQYLLTGDSQYRQAISRLYDASTNWDPIHTYGKKFWTERNQAAALQAAVSEWEISSSQSSHDRIRQIIDDTYTMTFKPKRGWPVRQCPQHTIHSHEGRGGNIPVCSPWMMALLSEGLWRYYLLTSDEKAASLLSAFGDFFAQYGSYYGLQKGKQVLAPRYLVAFEETPVIENNIWTDPQHSCDVASMLGKSVHVKTLSGEETTAVRGVFSTFGKLCRDVMDYVSLRYTKSGVAPVKPPRKFGWLYSSTYELPWLVEAYGQ